MQPHRKYFKNIRDAEIQKKSSQHQLTYHNEYKACTHRQIHTELDRIWLTQDHVCNSLRQIQKGNSPQISHTNKPSLKANSQGNGNGQILIAACSKTPKHILRKLGIYNYVTGMTKRANTGVAATMWVVLVKSQPCSILRLMTSPHQFT